MIVIFSPYYQYKNHRPCSPITHQMSGSTCHTRRASLARQDGEGHDIPGSAGRLASVLSISLSLFLPTTSSQGSNLSQASAPPGAEGAHSRRPLWWRTSHRSPSPSAASLTGTITKYLVPSPASQLARCKTTHRLNA